MIFIDIFYTREFLIYIYMFALHSTVEFGIYQQSKSCDLMGFNASQITGQKINVEITKTILKILNLK